MRVLVGRRRAVHVEAWEAVAESWLEGEDPRSRAARTTARDDPAQNTRMAVRSSIGDLLDKEPDPREIPEEVKQQIGANLPRLRHEWDSMFPENPISSAEPGDE